jgi:hypothetical protein
VVTLKGFYMLTILTTDEVLKMAEQCGLPEFENNESQAANLVMFAKLVEAKAAEREREACAKVCDELGEHWGDYKDTALLNGDVDLSNAASGEPRAAARLATAIRARGNV